MILLSTTGAHFCATFFWIYILTQQCTRPRRRFDLKMDAWVSHAGIFSATITFTQALQVAWVNSSTSPPIPIGSFPLTPLRVKSKRAYINQTVPFTITDERAFAAFTAAMITQPNFTWHLTSADLSVRALAFPTAHGLRFAKDLTLPGMDGFSGAVALRDFQLPRDAPDGAGIEFRAVTGLENPSAFRVDLGTVAFDLSYKGLYLGTGVGPGTVVQPGSNDVTLQGTLVRQEGADALATTSELFTKYLNGESADVVASGRSAVQADGSTVSWLSAGLEALALHVPFVHPGGAIAPIKSIEIGDMSLAFSVQGAWAPVSNSRTVRAAMELPFGFGLAIGEIANSFDIRTGMGVVAGLQTVRVCLHSRFCWVEWCTMPCAMQDYELTTMRTATGRVDERDQGRERDADAGDDQHHHRGHAARRPGREPPRVLVVQCVSCFPSNSLLAASGGVNHMGADCVLFWVFSWVGVLGGCSSVA